MDGRRSRSHSACLLLDSVWAILGGIDGPSTHIAEQVTTKAWLPLLCAVSSDRTANAAVVPWMFSLLPGDHLQAPPVDQSAWRREWPRLHLWSSSAMITTPAASWSSSTAAASRSTSHLSSSGSIARVRSPSPNWHSDRSKAQTGSRRGDRGSCELSRDREETPCSRTVMRVTCWPARPAADSQFIQQAGAAADGIIFPLLVELGPPWQEFEKAFPGPL